MTIYNRYLARGLRASAAALPPGLSLHDSALALRAKIGSSEFVKSDQFNKNWGIVAREGSFFIGFAKQKPEVFLGGVRFGAPASWRTFLFLCRRKPTRSAYPRFVIYW